MDLIPNLPPPARRGLDMMLRDLLGTGTAAAAAPPASGLDVTVPAATAPTPVMRPQMQAPTPTPHPNMQASTPADSGGGATPQGGLVGNLRKMLGGGGGGFGNILLDAASGTAGVDSSSSPVSAFAQGLAGAAGSRSSRSDTARKRSQEDEDRAFDRRMRVAAGERADRRAEISELKSLSSIMRDIRNGGLSTSESLRVESLVRDFARDLEAQALPPEEILTQTEAYREDVMARIGAGTSNGSAATSAGAVDAPSAAPAAGTQEDPAKPASHADFEALPSGAWFINPARLLQKK